MKRLTAAALVALGVGALLWRSRPDRPVGASLAVMRRFWSADPKTRLYNSVLFAADRELGVALLRADEALPREKDAMLCVPRPSEDVRRKAAFVLAPRRVHLAGGCAAPVVTAVAPLP